MNLGYVAVKVFNAISWSFLLLNNIQKTLNEERMKNKRIYKAWH